VVKEVLDPEGTVFFKGERWAAILDKGPAEPGEEVIDRKRVGFWQRVTKKDVNK